MSNGNQHFFISLNNAIALIKADIDYQMELRRHHKPMDKHTFALYSLPGIGKTQGVRSLAANEDQLCVIDINAEFGGSLSMPIQHVASDEQSAKVLHALNDNIATLKDHALQYPDLPHYLFLDEFNRGDEFMKQTIMQLLLECRLPGNPLPENVFVIAAGNTAENIFTDDESVENDVNSFDSASRDRIYPLYIQLSVSEWLSWAYQHNVSPEIVDYLGSKDADEAYSLMYMPCKNEDGTGSTPRSWTRMSSLIDNPAIRNNTILLKAAIFSAIGEDAGNKFLTYLEQGNSIDITKMLNDNDLDEFNTMTTGTKLAFFTSSLRLIERDLANGNQNKYIDTFLNYTQTNDQTALSRFLHTYVESGTLTNKYPLTNAALRQNSDFIELIASQSVNNV